MPGNAVSSVLSACWTPPGAGLVLLLCWPPQPVSRRACAPESACLPAARRPAAAGHRLGAQDMAILPRYTLNCIGRALSVSLVYENSPRRRRST